MHQVRGTREQLGPLMSAGLGQRDDGQEGRGTAVAVKSADVIAASQLLAQLGLSGLELFYFFFSLFFF